MTQWDEARLRADYPQMQTQVYLDHGGCPPFPLSLVRRYADMLTKAPVLLGNPHSTESPSSVETARRIQEARQRLLLYFDASPEEYAVIFTANATAALRLVADIFPWTSRDQPQVTDQNTTSASLKGWRAWLQGWADSGKFRDPEKFRDDQVREPKASQFWRLRQNHTSVLGMRSIATQYHVEDKVIDVEDVDTYLASFSIPDEVNGQTSDTSFHLFAYPAQCNFSGRRYPLRWIPELQATSKPHERWCVALDAAAYCQTGALSLTTYPADFVAISFYKMFGFPTNLGALLVRKDMAPYLRKSYYGGGTVTALHVNHPWAAFKQDLSARYEDGTLAFLEVMAIPLALDYMEQTFGGIHVMSKHAHMLTGMLRDEMKTMQHANGSFLCIIYGHEEDTIVGQGPVVNFNLKHSDGTFVSPKDVARLASLNGIHLRSGGFCNPGAIQHYLGVSDDDITRLHRCHSNACWNEQDIVDGRPVASIRVCLSYMSTRSDVDRFLDFLQTYFLQAESPSFNLTEAVTDKDVRVTQLLFYPIKSCRGISVERWPVTSRGLAFDREWSMVSSDTLKTLSQKDCPKLCLIQPELDLENNKLVVKCKGHPNLELDLEEQPTRSIGIRVCGRETMAMTYDGAYIHQWFSDVVGVSCYLVRRSLHEDEELLSNESPFLLVNQQCTEAMQPSCNLASEIRQFRPNIVIGGTLNPFEEEDWSNVRMGNLEFMVTGACRRCLVISVDQQTGEQDPKAFNSLVRYRKQIQVRQSP